MILFQVFLLLCGIVFLGIPLFLLGLWIVSVIFQALWGVVVLGWIVFIFVLTGWYESLKATFGR